MTYIWVTLFLWIKRVPHCSASRASDNCPAVYGQTGYESMLWFYLLCYHIIFDVLLGCLLFAHVTFFYLLGSLKLNHAETPAMTSMTKSKSNARHLA